MNNLVNELMAEAGFDPAAIERMGIMPQAERFAELMIRECYNAMWNEECMFSDLAQEENARMYRQLKQHFGIAV